MVHFFSLLGIAFKDQGSIQTEVHFFAQQASLEKKRGVHSEPPPAQSRGSVKTIFHALSDCFWGPISALLHGFFGCVFEQQEKALLSLPLFWPFQSLLSVIINMTTGRSGLYRNTSATGESLQWVVTSRTSAPEATHTKRGMNGDREREGIKIK